MQELRLIYANADTRHLTSAETAKQVQRVEALLYQLKEEGVEFPGRMRDHVAEACKLSKSKLARLKVIREKLIPLWAALYKKDKINEDFAYELAKLPEDYQRKLYDAQQDGLSVYGNSVESWSRAAPSFRKAAWTLGLYLDDLLLIGAGTCFVLGAREAYGRAAALATAGLCLIVYAIVVARSRRGGKR